MPSPCNVLPPHGFAYRTRIPAPCHMAFHLAFNTRSLAGNRLRLVFIPLSRVVMRLTPSPSPSTYESRVSFDTFDNKDASDFSFTLKVKHRHYSYTRGSRTFLCGTDQNDYSEFALEWLLDELVDDGDEVVCLRVVDKDSKINSDSSLEQGKYRTEAHKLMEHIQAKTKEDDKSISLVLEFAVGKVQDTIQRMVCRYAHLVTGGTSFLNIHSEACEEEGRLLLRN